MNKSIIKTMSVAVAMATLCSCGDFLEPKEKSEFVPKDANSLNELLLGEAYPTTSTSNLWGFVNLLDDDITRSLYQTPATGLNIDKYFAPYTWQGDMWKRMKDAGATNVNQYYAHYRKILGCNAILDYIDTVEDTEENINYVLAQAYALRGFYYLTLVNIFGQPYSAGVDGLGVPIKLSSEIENAPLTRSTVGECYNQIFSDLSKAEELYNSLPESRRWRANFRTNLPMVQMLLSRAYLYTENWANSAEYAKKVIDNKNFALLDLNTLPEYTTQYPTIPYYLDYNSYTNNPECIWVYGSATDMTMWLSDYQSNKVWAYFKASDELMNTLAEYDGDLRHKCYVVRSWKSVTTNVNGVNKSAPFPQAFGKINVQQRYGYVVGGTGINGRCIRLSEAYLNYAEAQTMLGNGGEAMNVLNELRKYRMTEDTYAAVSLPGNDDILSFVRNERRRELCYEGFRWFDLRRWGMNEIKHVWCESATENFVYTLPTADPGFTVPIPDTSLELNSQLVQNPLPAIPRTGVAVE